MRIPFLQPLIDFLCKITTQICFSPKKGTVFAVLSGDHKGKMFVYIQSTFSEYQFLSIPDINNHYIRKEQFKIGRQNNIVEMVEVLPKDMYIFLKDQYMYNKKYK